MMLCWVTWGGRYDAGDEKHLGHAREKTRKTVLQPYYIRALRILTSRSKVSQFRLGTQEMHALALHASRHRDGLVALGGELLAVLGHLKSWEVGLDRDKIAFGTKPRTKLGCLKPATLPSLPTCTGVPVPKRSRPVHFQCWGGRSSHLLVRLLHHLHKAILLALLAFPLQLPRVLPSSCGLKGLTSPPLYPRKLKTPSAHS